MLISVFVFFLQREDLSYNPEVFSSTAWTAILPTFAKYSYHRNPGAHSFLKMKQGKQSVICFHVQFLIYYANAGSGVFSCIIWNGIILGLPHFDFCSENNH